MTLVILAETFGNTANINAPVPGSSWVGSSPRLAEADEGRYGRLDTLTQVSGTKFIGCEVTGALEASLTVTARYRLTTSDGNPRAVSLAVYGFASDTYAAIGNVEIVAAPGDGVWRESSGTLGVSSSTATDFAACDRIFVGASPQAKFLGDDLVFDLDWLTFSGPTPEPATVHPLRLMQRGDGLGMGSGRVYGTGTRQASGRVFGPY